MRIKKCVILFTVLALSVCAAVNAPAVLLFHDDFEKDEVGKEPAKWFSVIRMAFGEVYWNFNVSLRNPKTTLSFSTFYQKSSHHQR